ncbi:Inner membrane protein yebE [Bordetella ansorpii]|uniref:Inner membrane protein yebE n=1 Tax=Bordetella ansorpii TaxID=288768 RepID=A0A157QJ26_9BORD|nr:tellurite resistance TerB family protein [Bordetella ansorpii]SAI45912.1 Inner membrane protein yebE [Bordetella ansorpii]
MSARQLLDHLLQSGQGLVQDATSRLQGASSQAQGGAGGLLGKLGSLTQGGGGAGSFLGGLGGGALGGGALGLLLSNKKARKIGGNVAMYGGLAALGALAYRAYGDWQRKQAATDGAAAMPATAPAGQPLALPEPQTMDRVLPDQVEQHSNAVLVAMIGAAKADGHVGDQERHQLEDAMVKLSGDAGDRAWLEAELARPLDPAAVARAARTPEMAAEMYLASLLVVDEESYMERAYLDELARQLKLPAGLKEQLETQAAQLQVSEAA